MASEKRQGVLIVFLGLIVLWFYFNFLLGPAIGKTRSLGGEIKTLRQNLETIKNAITKLPELERKTVYLRSKTQELKIRFPSQSELPGLLEQISELAEKAEVEILEISPRKTQAEESSSEIYEELPILMTATSGYHELGAFINQLENSERIFTVKEIHIRTNPSNSKRHHVNLVLSTFVREMERI